MNSSSVQHEQAIDHRNERVHDMLDPDHRRALGSGDRGLRIRSTSAAHLGLGQAAGDLVQQQQPRLASPGARASSSRLRSSSAEPASRPVRLVGKAALLEQFDDSRIGVALATTAAERRRHDQILEYAHAIERLRNSKRSADAHATAVLRRETGDIAAREDDAPGVGPHRAARNTEQRGLAGAVRSDDAERLALGNREVDRVGHDHRAELLRDFVEGEDGGHVSRLARGPGTPALPLAGEGGGTPGTILMHFPSLSLRRKRGRRPLRRHRNLGWSADAALATTAPAAVRPPGFPARSCWS